MDNEPIMVSVIVPVKNEEECVPELAAEIRQSMEKSPWSWECIWINDGSTDATAGILAELSRNDARHRRIELDRNYGQSAALAAGFSEARGEVLVTLDGDGQNDPADMPMLIRELQDRRVDMVNGVRAKRRDNWVRRVSSRLANGFRNWLTNEKVSDVGCAIRAFRKETVQHIPVFKGMHRFLPTLVRMQGYRIVEIPVGHRPRTKGRTKYGISNRLWVGIADTFAVCWMQRRLVWPKWGKTDQVPGDAQ